MPFSLLGGGRFHAVLPLVSLAQSFVCRITVGDGLELTGSPSPLFCTNGQDSRSRECGGSRDVDQLEGGVQTW